MHLQESISRKNFLKSMGIGGAALMAVLASCTNSTDVITPGGGATIDLATTLKTVGSYAYSGNIIVARISTGDTAASFVAIAKSCTHEGTSVVYQSNKFYCPNHGATFSNTGSVTQGPANRSLTKYNVTVSGNTLTIG
jgi:cytochrome b6-f complex iron-sulfur subunit